MRFFQVIAGAFIAYNGIVTISHGYWLVGGLFVLFAGYLFSLSIKAKKLKL